MRPWVETERAVTGRQAHPNRSQKRHMVWLTPFLPEAPDLVSASRLGDAMSPAWPALGFLKGSHRLWKKGWIMTAEHPPRVGVGGDGVGDSSLSVKE